MVKALQKKRAWLLTDSPSSNFQALCGRIYRNWLSFSENTLAMGGLFIVTALVLVAIFSSFIAPYGFDQQDLDNRLAPFSHAHWFGTDELGRDIFSRIVYGCRLTLYIVILVVLIASPIGLIIGTVAGYMGGWVDSVLMRITDIFLALPKLILALAFVAALGPGIENAVYAISLTAWPPYARMSRAETLTIRNADFIQAIRIQGGSNLRIIFRHIMPMCISSLVVRVTLDMAGIILTAAGLGFLGLGAQPPSPEWGAMIASGRKYLLDQWWVATMPGMAIFIVSLGFNLLGDGLRDVLDPKYK